MNYKQKMIQLKRRRDFMYARCTLWHDQFIADYKKSIWAYSAEEREDFKSYAKSDYWIYQDMRTKLRQIKNRIWVTERRALMKQVMQIINSKE